MISRVMRHWISGSAILIAVAMVILGQTVLAGRLRDFHYVLYWSACMLVTLMAAIAALFEMMAIRKQSRREHIQLVEQTFKNVEED
jgi:hypothetical protein